MVKQSKIKNQSEIENQVQQIENPFDPSRSGLEQSAYNGFEVARLRILRKIRR